MERKKEARQMELLESLLQGEFDAFVRLFTSFGRYLFPVLALLILLRCAWPLLTFRKEPELWAYLLRGEERIPVTHWESTIGSTSGCDIHLDEENARLYGVLTHYDDGSWSISTAGSAEIRCNGEPVQVMEELHYGDILAMGGTSLVFASLDAAEQEAARRQRTRAGRDMSPTLTLVLLTVFQLFAALELMASGKPENMPVIAMSFAGLCGMMWGLFFLMKLIRRHAFEVETIAFFLSTLGLAVIASDDPSKLTKQVIAVAMGLIVYLCIGWALRDLARAQAVRYLMAAAGVSLLVFNLVFGTEINGAKNWIYIGPFSFQPSELVKLCFVFAGASTLDRLVSRRNLWLFIAYTGVCCGCLALMNDFGTAMIFFLAFVIVALMRSGSFATVALICAGTGLAGGAGGCASAPMSMRRFSAWRHVWEYALEGGYQQTRAHDVYRLRRSVRSGSGKWLVEIRGGQRHRSGLRFRVGGVGPANRVDDGAVCSVVGGVYGPRGEHGAQQLLRHQCVRGHDVCCCAGAIFNVFGTVDYPAPDRRDLPLCLQRRLQHDFHLGPAGLCQGCGYAPRRQLCHS